MTKAALVAGERPFSDPERAAGLETDEGVRNSTTMPGVRVAWLTDPWGTCIEITEGLQDKKDTKGTRGKD